MTKAKRDAFIEGVEKNLFKNRRRDIYELMKLKPLVSLSDFKSIGIPEKTASGRISELMDMGLIMESGETKNGQSLFKLVHGVDRQNELIEERQRAKYEKWKKVGIINGYFEIAEKEKSRTAKLTWHDVIKEL